jgi:hypothetical protein
VSLALWNDMGAAKLLVVGGGSWSLVAHDVTTGRIVAHMQLPAEPADIVVDDVANHAYISCQGDNSVVRIDLQTFTQLSRYPVGSQRPRFLYLDDTVSPREVFVAPFLSGNNTTASQPPPWPTQPGPEGSIDRRSVVVDLDGVSGPDLPDEDLYRILASQPWNTPAMPVLHGAGTLLTAHGRSPDGKYWMLSTEAKNADHNTEDAHRGDFAFAQLVIATNVGQPGRPTPGTLIDLDVPASGVKSQATSMSFPWALAFHTSGHAAICSSTSDRITFVDANGARYADVTITANTNPFQPAMPPQIGNAIPRDLEWLHANNLLMYVLFR